LGGRERERERERESAAGWLSGAGAGDQPLGRSHDSLNEREEAVAV